MSDSTQQYILARPIEAKKLDGGNVLMIFPGSDLKSFVNENLFEADFVPLDIPAIENHLEDIILELQNDDVATCINKILVLFGLENKENDNGH